MISASSQGCCVTMGKFPTLSAPLLVHGVVRNQWEWLRNDWRSVWHGIGYNLWWSLCPADISRGRAQPNKPSVYFWELLFLKLCHASLMSHPWHNSNRGTRHCLLPRMFLMPARISWHFCVAIPGPCSFASWKPECEQITFSPHYGANYLI